MVKSLLEMCLNLLNKPCEPTDISKFCLNCGLRQIPFKLGHKVRSKEFYYCTCRRGYFRVTFLKTKCEWGVSPRAQNCSHWWFVFLMEIKLETLYKYRNNLIRFTSLPIDFFSFINQFKYIYIRPGYTNVEHFDLMIESFHYYLNEDNSLLCNCSDSGPLQVNKFLFIYFTYKFFHSLKNCK